VLLEQRDSQQAYSNAALLDSEKSTGHRIRSAFTICFLKLPAGDRVRMSHRCCLIPTARRSVNAKAPVAALRGATAMQRRFALLQRRYAHGTFHGAPQRVLCDNLFAPLSGSSARRKSPLSSLIACGRVSKKNGEAPHDAPPSNSLGHRRALVALRCPV